MPETAPLATIRALDFERPSKLEVFVDRLVLTDEAEDHSPITSLALADVGGVRLRDTLGMAELLITGRDGRPFAVLELARDEARGAHALILSLAPHAA